MKHLVIAALALLAICLGLGVWVGIIGAPYPTVLLTIHKLTGVAFAVLCVISFIHEERQFGMTAHSIVPAAAFAILLIALLVTGGIMAGREEPAATLRIVHAAAGVILSFAAGWKIISYLVG